MVALQGMCLPLPACSLEGAGSPDATRPKPRSKKRKPITVDRGSSPVLLQGVEILVHGHPYVPVSSAAMTTTTTSSKADSVAVAKAPVPGPPRRLSSQHRASNGAPAVSLLPPTVSADVSAAAPVVQGDTASASSEPIHEPLPLAQCDLDTASAILYPALWLFSCFSLVRSHYVDDNCAHCHWTVRFIKQLCKVCYFRTHSLDTMRQQRSPYWSVLLPCASMTAPCTVKSDSAVSGR